MSIGVAVTCLMCNIVDYSFFITLPRRSKDKFAKTEKIPEKIFSGRNNNLELQSSYSVSLKNPIYDTNRDIRILRKETLKNIVVEHEQDCPYKQFLIYKCSKQLCGGLGDRERGIVSSFLLALLTNRTFVIYMTKPCELENFIDPFFYNWTKCKKFIETVQPENISEHYHICGQRLDSFYTNLPNMNFKEVWTHQIVIMHMNVYNHLMNNIKLHKDIQRQMNWIINMTNPEIVHLVLHTLFKPKKRLNERLFELVKNNLNGRHLVCSHIRIGKNPSIPGDLNLSEGKPNTQTIYSFLKRFKNPQKYALYIASDSNEVRHDIMSNFKNAFNVNRTIVHVDRLKNVYKTTNVCEGLFTALLEQQMLSLCDTLLITRSNFGTIAAYMRGSSENLFLYQTDIDQVFLTNLTNIQIFYRFF
jgi:hypothetical protein